MSSSSQIDVRLILWNIIAFFDEFFQSSLLFLVSLVKEVQSIVKKKPRKRFKFLELPVFSTPMLPQGKRFWEGKYQVNELLMLPMHEDKNRTKNMLPTVSRWNYKHIQQYN